MMLPGNIVDIHARKIYPGKVVVEGGKITKIEPSENVSGTYILPGFIDSHVHIESSMLVPSEFARIAVVHGTVAAVSDPHEIANVLGVEGIKFMIENGKKVPFKFFFGAPSCVPATKFETSGAEITISDLRDLFEMHGLKYLSEMMNYPGVLSNDPEVIRKIRIARELGRPIDGHAPGLKGEDARKYAEAGQSGGAVISTDHECYSLDEAEDKIKFGMKILIREGSAAKNYETLHTLIKSHPAKVMFCSDDKHPNDLVISHINELVKRSVEKGYDIFDVLRAACLNPADHYGLEVGLLREGDPADFIIVDNLKDFTVKQTYIDGKLVAENGKTLIESIEAGAVNNFRADKKSPGDIELQEVKAITNDGVPTDAYIRVIEALEGQLITNEIREKARCIGGKLVTNPDRDILKLTVTERYSNGKPSVAFIKNFGLKKGAIASCVAHDSHNIIAVGVSDEDICNAVNAIIDSRGGVSVSHEGKTEVLPLPVAGIMSNEDGYTVAEKYTKIDMAAKSLGTKLNAPFMTLSFMALLVIPHLKLSDKGLFDGNKFCYVSLEAGDNGG